jgi:hypothetical protein
MVCLIVVSFINFEKSGVDGRKHSFSMKFSPGAISTKARIIYNCTVIFPIAVKWSSLRKERNLFMGSVKESLLKKMGQYS